MIGRRLGPWTLKSEVGRGAMGNVYRASDEAGRTAAVKVLAPDLARDELFVGRFERESEVLKQLDHPHIVAYYDSGRDGEHIYLAMEFVDGVNYETRLQQRGRLPWTEVLTVARQTTDALKHAHDHGVIHRDLKPANILTRGDPDGPDGVNIKLTDFGVAKLFASPPLTAAGSFVGTAAYLAPEQATGKTASKRSDFYSLGCVLYAMTTGRPPFTGDSTSEMLHQHRFAQPEQPIRLVPDIPHDLNSLILQLLEKDPQKRPADGSILLKQIDRIVGKLERQGRGHETVTDHDTDPTRMQPTVIDGEQIPFGPGPATFAAGFVRAELERQNKGSWLNQALNHPAVLVPLFILCVAGIVYGIWRPYPIEKTETDSTTKSVVVTKLPSEAERFFYLGLRHLQSGKIDDARRVWGNLIAVFDGVNAEKQWVERARTGLNDLKSMPEAKRESVAAALERAKLLFKKQKNDEAEALLKALDELYGDDPEAAELIEQFRKDRQKS